MRKLSTSHGGEQEESIGGNSRIRYIGELDPSTQGNERTKRILGDRIRAFHHELRQLGIEVNIAESHPLPGRVGFSADRIRLKQEQFDRAHEDLQARLVSIAQSALQGSSMQ